MLIHPRRLVLAAAVLALLLGAIQADVLEDLFLYFPDRRLDAQPDDVGLRFEEVSFAASDGVQLHGWLVPGPRPITLLWLHGNAGNISHRVQQLRLLHDHTGVSILLLDYRGYGRSAGKPSEEGLYLDGEAAVAYLRSRQDLEAQPLVLYGQSLGANVAVEVARRTLPEGLVLEAAFPSLAYMARLHYPFVPVWPLLAGKYDAQATIQEVATPLLLLHGEWDRIVPLDGGRAVFDAAVGPKDFYVVKGAGHNDPFIVGGEGYFGALRTFLDRTYADMGYQVWQPHLKDYHPHNGREYWNLTDSWLDK